MRLSRPQISAGFGPPFPRGFLYRGVVKADIGRHAGCRKVDIPYRVARGGAALGYVYGPLMRPR